MNHSATYSPEDNKLRMYPAYRLPKEEYEKLKAAGFSWAPKQECFYAPAWTPCREDVLLSFCDEIGDEDKSLVDRAEERAERFEGYGENRAHDAETARRAVSAIADNIPLGQPILVGHHSERHARRDAEKIESGMRKAVKMWETSQYWERRAEGAIRAAKYKERPDVRARRIKGLEADQRKRDKELKEAQFCLKFWSGELPRKAERGGGFVEVTYETALAFCNRYDHAYHCFTLAEFPRTAPASQYEGQMSYWSALGGSDGPSHAIITVEQARALRVPALERWIDHVARWLAHLANRLAYERAMMQEAGGIASDKVKPEKGGAVRCLWSPYSSAGGWAYIQKVNRVTVTIRHKWRSDSDRFHNHNEPFDKLYEVMSKAAVDQARAEGRVKDVEGGIGFMLYDAKPKEEEAPAAESAPAAVPAVESGPSKDSIFKGMKETLRAGVKVVSAPQLFPTPSELAARMVEESGLRDHDRVLEPSAGTGRIVQAVIDSGKLALVDAVEIDSRLVESGLRPLVGRTVDVTVCPITMDFLKMSPGARYDRIIMNPPFAGLQDVAHILHAHKFLAPFGRLVAICADGPRQNAQLKPFVEARGGSWEPLPEGTFSGEGTNVRTVLLTIPGGGENQEARECAAQGAAVHAAMVQPQFQLV